MQLLQRHGSFAFAITSSYKMIAGLAGSIFARYRATRSSSRRFIWITISKEFLPAAQPRSQVRSTNGNFGAGAAKAFAQRGFRPVTGERCGEHDVATYLTRVKAMEREFLRLTASP
jgi:hypothetical protein